MAQQCIPSCKWWCGIWQPLVLDLIIYCNASKMVIDTSIAPTHKGYSYTVFSLNTEFRECISKHVREFVQIFPHIPINDKWYSNYFNLLFYSLIILIDDSVLKTSVWQVLITNLNTNVEELGNFPFECVIHFFICSWVMFQQWLAVCYAIVSGGVVFLLKCKRLECTRHIPSGSCFFLVAKPRT